MPFGRLYYRNCIESSGFYCMKLIFFVTLSDVLPPFIFDPSRTKGDVSSPSSVRRWNGLVSSDHSGVHLHQAQRWTHSGIQDHTSHVTTFGEACAKDWGWHQDRTDRFTPLRDSCLTRRGLGWPAARLKWRQDWRPRGPPWSSPFAVGCWKSLSVSLLNSHFFVCVTLKM